VIGNRRPLAGIRILDLTVALSGPYASLLLAGLGAEVVHVEAPAGGDIARTNPPFVGPEGFHFGAPHAGDISLTILNRGRNKKSITLDLKAAEGRRLFLDLVEHFDVVIENMSEGTAERLGVGYATVAAINPRMVYASISAFGDPGVFPGLKGMDVLVQALSGIMEVTGARDGPPTRIGLPIADMIAPMYAVTGILSALLARAQTDAGQHVKVSMLDCLASWVAEEHFDVLASAGYPMRSGNSHDRLAPFGVYEAADGHVAIVAFNAAWMNALCQLIGRPEICEDPRFMDRGPRMRHARELNGIIEDWTRQFDVAEIVRRFTECGVPCVPVRKPVEVLADPALRDRRAVVGLAHPELGEIAAVGMGLPIAFSGCDVGFDVPAEALGASNDHVFATFLGLDPDRLGDLRARGII
jgi:crotonobetainyl-CoA:carnitine CoA-transferase CaiB-like acyl-CoA transferase